RRAVEQRQPRQIAGGQRADPGALGAGDDLVQLAPGALALLPEAQAGRDHGVLHQILPRCFTSRYRLSSCTVISAGLASIQNTARLRRRWITISRSRSRSPAVTARLSSRKSSGRAFAMVSTLSSRTATKMTRCLRASCPTF